jgi:rhodanese-related sulfurtransferase
VFFDTNSFDDKTESLSLLAPVERIKPHDLKSLMDRGAFGLHVDVLPEHEFKICGLKGSLNISIDSIRAKPYEAVEIIKEKLREMTSCRLVVVCCRGNDSQIATRLLKKHFSESGIEIVDLIGGLTGWSDQVQPDLPKY